jgi:hypothetical protein
VRTHVGLAAVGVTVTALLGVTGWILVPTKAVSWIFVICFLPLLWAFLESAAGGSAEAARAIMRMHRLLIAALALIMAVDVGTDLAIYAGLLGSDGRLVEQRFSGLLNGALFALWGNHLPKLMSPWSLEREPFDWQGVHRFVGRVALAAGLGLVFVWSTLPIRDADRAATILIVTACALALGYKLLSVLRYSGRERSSMQP